MRTFMDAHQSFGEVTTQPHRSTVSVAASAIDGSGRVSVRAKTVSGYDIGGLLHLDDARELVRLLSAAIDHAEAMARSQMVTAIPDLERRLAAARAASQGQED